MLFCCYFLKNVIFIFLKSDGELSVPLKDKVKDNDIATKNEDSTDNLQFDFCEADITAETAGQGIRVSETEKDKVTETNHEISPVAADESKKKTEERTSVRRNSLGLNRFFHLTVVDETSDKTLDINNKKKENIDEKKFEGEGGKNSKNEGDRNEVDENNENMKKVGVLNDGSQDSVSEDHGTEYITFVSADLTLLEVNICGFSFFSIIVIDHYC